MKYTKYARIIITGVTLLVLSCTTESIEIKKQRIDEHYINNLLHGVSSAEHVGDGVEKKCHDILIDNLSCMANLREFGDKLLTVKVHDNEIEIHTLLSKTVRQPCRVYANKNMAGVLLDNNK